MGMKIFISFNKNLKLFDDTINIDIFWGSRGSTYKLHRLDGPADISFSGASMEECRYYLSSSIYTKKAYLKTTRKLLKVDEGVD